MISKALADHELERVSAAATPRREVRLALGGEVLFVWVCSSDLAPLGAVVLV